MFKGWNNGERALVVGLVLTIVILALFGQEPELSREVSTNNEANNGGQAGNQVKGYDFLNLADVVAQWLMAVGTFLLFWLTLRTLRHSEKTAAEALNASTEAVRETRRSVDAFIKAEDSRVLLSHVGIVPGSWGTDKVAVSYGLTCVGRTQARMGSVKLRAYVTDNAMMWLQTSGTGKYTIDGIAGTTLAPDMTMFDVSQVGGTWPTLSVEPPLTKEQIAGLECETLGLIFEGVVTYRTMFSPDGRRLVFTHRYRAEQKAFREITGEDGLNTDEPIEPS